MDLVESYRNRRLWQSTGNMCNTGTAQATNYLLNFFCLSQCLFWGGIEQQDTRPRAARRFEDLGKSIKVKTVTYSFWRYCLRAVHSVFSFSILTLTGPPFFLCHALRIWSLIFLYPGPMKPSETKPDLSTSDGHVKRMFTAHVSSL